MEGLDKILDVLRCISKFDETESLENKGKYFEVIQKDVKKYFNKPFIYLADSRIENFFIDYRDVSNIRYAKIIKNKDIEVALVAGFSFYLYEDNIETLEEAVIVFKLLKIAIDHTSVAFAHLIKSNEKRKYFFNHKNR